MRPTSLLLAVVLSTLACGSARGEARAKLARSGTIEASWSGGRDPSRERTTDFVVVRTESRLQTHAIHTYDDGHEESAPIGYIDTDRCVMVRHGTGPQFWPDGPGRIKIVNMGPMEDIPTDCSEYGGTPAQRLTPKK